MSRALNIVLIVMMASVSMIYLPVMAQDNADTLTIALTSEKVDVDAGFSGAQLTLFGVIGESSPPRQTDGADILPTQIIATITGPKHDVSSRPIVRAGPIWTASSSTIIRDVPGLYYVLSSAPLTQFVAQDRLISKSLDIEQLHFEIAHPENVDHPETKAMAQETEGAITPDMSMIDAMTAALIENRTARGLFRHSATDIRRLENGLFSVTVDLPAQTPVGDYIVNVSAWRGGMAIAEDEAALSVRKAGLERQIYEFARNQAFAYGILCVLISLFAGWAVSLIFRRS